MSSKGEFHYLDKSGRKQDKLLHEPILDNLDPEGAKRIAEERTKRMLALGMTPEEIRLLFGPDPE